MKKIFFFLFSISSFIYANYRICFDIGPQFVYQPTYKVWSTGVSVPILFKFYKNNQNVFTFLSSYGFNSLSASFDVDWFDPVSYSTQTAKFHLKNYYHTIVFGPGFEYYFNVNWQKENVKYLKNFYPYMGTTFNFNFIIIRQNYTKLNGNLPNYLEDKYSTQTTVLPPTIGVSLYFGTKIKVKQYYLDLKTQYAVLIPESKTKGLFINHFFQIFLGFETSLPDTWFTVKTQ